MSKTESLVPYLPYLRRYARALSGSQASGDSYVRAALSALLAGGKNLDSKIAPRVALYKLFHAIWSGPADHYDQESMSAKKGSVLTAEDRLRNLSAAKRAALLLTAVEGFSIAEAAEIIGTTPDEVEAEIVSAQRSIEKELVSKVLIIEDEPVIAIDLANLVSELGHEVVAVVSTHKDAVKQAHLKDPGLILADINLGEGGSGIEAVQEILSDFHLPVIFVTAYPEALLTGERPEPAYLITKPFLPETIQATVSQALFFHPMKQEAV